jgi:UDP-glucose 4-epimerase
LIGAGQASDYGMVVPCFITRVLALKPLHIYGDGHQTRTFSDIGQAVEMLWAVINRVSFDGQAINLATNDHPISILDLARLVGCVADQKVTIEYIPREEVYGAGFIDVPDRKPSLIRLKEILGPWKPIPLEATIRSIFDYETLHQKHPAQVYDA